MTQSFWVNSWSLVSASANYLTVNAIVDWLKAPRTYLDEETAGMYFIAVALSFALCALAFWSQDWPLKTKKRTWEVNFASSFA